MKLFIIGLSLVLFACKGQKKAGMQEDIVTAGVLELVLRDDNSGATVSEILMITDSKALRSFFSKINSTRKPGLPIPDVDFTKEMILITCSGERTDGVMPTLEAHEETSTQLILTSIQKPKRDKASGAITTPFSLYKMPLTEKEIVFK